MVYLFIFFLFFPVAYLNLGTSLIALGRCQEAASVLREASKLDGVGLRDRSAHENARIASLLQLGGLYADQGKLQRALAVYREALHTLPERYPPQVSLLFLSDHLTLIYLQIPFKFSLQIFSLFFHRFVFVLLHATSLR